MAFEGERIEIDAQELLALENKKLTEEVKNLKQLVFDQSERFAKEVEILKESEVDRNEKLIEEVNNLKQLMVEMYHATTMGCAPPPIPSNLLGVAPTIVHQAHGISPTIEDPQYSPDFPQYYNASKVAGSSTICSLEPPPPVASPLVSISPSAGLGRKKSFEKKEGKERSPERMDEKRYKQPNSCPRISQKHYSQHYPWQNQRHSIPPLQKAWPYAPKHAYPQWHTPIPRSTCHTRRAPYNQYQSLPEFSYRSRRHTFIPRPKYKKAREEKKRKFTPIGESYAGVFEKLQALGMLSPVKGGMRQSDKGDDSRQCAYHSGARGHDTENCHFLKKEIQALIDNGQIQVEGPDVTNINQIPLPAHDS